MVASREVEIPKKKVFGRRKGRGSGALAQIVGRTAIRFLRKLVVLAAEDIGADMFEFAAPEIGEVISCKKSFKSAAKSVGKRTLEKQLDSGSKQRKINPTKSTKWSSRSQRDVFTNISRSSYQTTICGTNILRHCLEILAEKSQIFFGIEVQTCQRTWLRYIRE